MKIIDMSPSQCAELHALAFPDSWSLLSFQALLAGNGVRAIGEDGKGFLLTRSVCDEMEVLTIAVAPEHQRQGLAAKLMLLALEVAAQQGVQSCFLEVDTQNIAAIGCYEKLGFSAISIRKNYYVTSQGARDAVVMQKRW